MRWRQGITSSTRGAITFNKASTAYVLDKAALSRYTTRRGENMPMTSEDKLIQMLILAAFLMHIRARTCQKIGKEGSNP